MQELNFKPEFSGTVGRSKQSSETAQSLRARYEKALAYPSDERAVPLVIRLMLLLRKLTGAMLCGAALAVMFGNILICGAILLLGPEITIESLAQIHGLSV
jgi:hypothetical protein